MLLYYAIATLHIIVCVILVLVVLLQSGKGADLAGAFGGTTQTAFGSRGPASFLSKMTTIAAIVFMVTCISLSMFSNKKTEAKSILETTKQQEPARPVEKKTEEKTPDSAPLTKEQIRKIQEEYEAKKNQQAAPAPAQQQPAPKPTESKQPAK
jgi:preprotein translocase subunit SecG